MSSAFHLVMRIIAPISVITALISPDLLMNTMSLPVMLPIMYLRCSFFVCRPGGGGYIDCVMTYPVVTEMLPQLCEREACIPSRAGNCALPCNCCLPHMTFAYAFLCGTGNAYVSLSLSIYIHSISLCIYIYSIQPEAAQSPSGHSSYGPKTTQHFANKQHLAASLSPIAAGVSPIWLLV